jgi:hypothetical protein
MSGPPPARLDLLRQARDGLPPHLNAGMLFGEGGFCILGWMLFSAGLHHITFYGNTIGVVDPESGGPATDVVARTYGLAQADVEALAQLNDRTPSAQRVAAVAVRLDELIRTVEP